MKKYSPVNRPGLVALCVLSFGAIGCGPDFAALEKYDQSFLSLSKDFLAFNERLLAELPAGKKWKKDEFLETTRRQNRMQVDFYRRMVDRTKAIAPPPERKRFHSLLVEFYEIPARSTVTQSDILKTGDMRRALKVYGEMESDMTKLYRKMMAEILENVKSEKIAAALRQMYEQ